MTRRERFERVYAATDAVALVNLDRESSDAEADDDLLRKMVAAQGLTKFVGLEERAPARRIAGGVQRLARRSGSRMAN